jgi:molybdopterin-guanine dinucleotide biosynthesis protein A
MEVTGIILAGGKSTRMGTDKALIKVGDKSLLETVIDNCKTVCKSIIISSNNPAHGKYGYQVVADEIKDCGPIGGIYSCLRKSETEWNFVISVDTPFVTSDFIQFLVGQTKNCDVVLPVHSGEKEPLIALYNKSGLPEVEKLIELRQFKMHHLIAKLNAHYVDAFEWVEKTPLLFKNLNNPDDLQ